MGADKPNCCSFGKRTLGAVTESLKEELALNLSFGRIRTRGVSEQERKDRLYLFGGSSIHFAVSFDFKT